MQLLLFLHCLVRKLIVHLIVSMNLLKKSDIFYVISIQWCTRSNKYVLVTNVAVIVQIHHTLFAVKSFKHKPAPNVALPSINDFHN